MSPHPALGVTYASLVALGVQGGVEVARTAEQLGYRSFWVAEANGTEAFSLLGAAGAAAPSLDLGTGVLALQLRTPAARRDGRRHPPGAAPGAEIIIGVGISSPVVVGRWHGATYLAKRPLAHTREYVTLLRECLSGESVSFKGDFYEISRFRLGVRLGERRPKIVIGALERGDAPARRRGRGRRAAQLHPGQPRPVVGRAGAQGRQRRRSTRTSTPALSPIATTASRPARRDLFSYAVVDAYAKSFALAGYADEVADIRERHAAGDRDGAVRGRVRPDGRRHRRHGRRRARSATLCGPTSTRGSRCRC